METATAPASGYAELTKAIDDSVRYTSNRAYLFGFLYFGVRTFLIIAATCASAKGIKFPEDHAAMLSLLVAIGTALDTLYRTQARYRENFLANDRFWGLQQDLAGIVPSDADALKKIRERWNAMNDQYGKAILPE